MSNLLVIQCQQHVPADSFSKLKNTLENDMPKGFELLLLPYCTKLVGDSNPPPITFWYNYE